VVATVTSYLNSPDLPIPQPNLSSTLTRTHQRSRHSSKAFVVMAAAQDYKFEGWLGMDPESAKGKMVWGEFPHVKPFEETDVDIQITHCGICGSDLHTLRSGWGATP